MTRLDIANLSFFVGNKQLVKSISFSMKSGEIIALLGPNGAGKTTLLKTIVGINKSPCAHENDHQNIIKLNGTLINDWPIHQRVAHGLIYLPQHTSLFTQMSVHDNLWLVYEYHNFWKNQPVSHFDQEVTMWLERTNLTQTIQQQAGSLSGGQKRKLEIIRTLLMRPKLVLLDEPFAGVDPKSIYELKTIFTDMATAGIGVLISDHHVDQLLAIANHIFVVLNGKIVTSGTVEDILQSSHTKESYLGNQFYDEIAEKFLRSKK